MTFTDRLRSLSPIDAAALLVVLAAVGGVVWSPKLSNTVARATGAMKPVEVSVDVRNTSAADPDGLIREALDSGRTTLVVRNQPAGSAELVRVDDIRRKLTAVQPDGSVVTADDPNRSIQGMLDARFVLLEGRQVIRVDDGDVFRPPTAIAMSAKKFAQRIGPSAVS